MTLSWGLSFVLLKRKIRTMTRTDIEEQIAVIRSATAKATKSKKAALKFMKDAGMGTFSQKTRPSARRNKSSKKK